MGLKWNKSDLPTLAEKKKQEISAACKATIVAGIDLEMDGETVHFNLAEVDQTNISDLFKIVELGGTEFPYQSDGGVCHIYTAAQIAQIFVAANTHKTTQLTYHNALKKYIEDNAADSEAVAKVYYGMELPEPYAAEVESKLAVAKEQMDAIVAKMVP